MAKLRTVKQLLRHKPLLYNSHGKMLAGISEGASGVANNYRIPLNYSNYNKSFTELFPESDTVNCRSMARQIYNNIPPIRKAIDDIAAYAVGDGWSPIFSTDDPVWNEDTAYWLESKVFPTIDVNGIADFNSILRMISVYSDVDGDTLTVFSTSAEGIFPMIQTFMANRIQTREKVIQDGKYKGKKCINGVIISSTGRPLAYNLVGETIEDDVQVPVEACVLNYEPISFDAIRGVSSLSPIIQDVRTYKDVYDLYKQAVRMEAAMPIAHITNDSIDALTEQLGEHTRTDNGVTEPVYGRYINNAEVMLFRVGSGEDIKFLNSTKPEQNVMDFIKYLLRSAYSGLGWFYELYDMSTLGGANVRLVLAKAQRRIEQKQLMIYRVWKRTIQYCVATGIINGDLPYKPKWYLCEPVLPRKVTVDYGRDTKTDIEAVKFGLLSHDQACSYEGYSSRDVLTAEARYLSDAQTVAANYGVPVEWLIQRFPNQVVESNEKKKEDENV